MSESIRIETRLFLSKAFPPGTGGAQLGHYTVTAIPSTRPTEGEAVLEFVDEAEKGEGSNPEEEANIVCNLLSVILQAKVRRSGLRINAIDVPVQDSHPLYPMFRERLELKGADGYLMRAQGLPIDLARQLSRSCRAYASALDFIPSDPTFAFFLLVVAVECLSSQPAIISPSEVEVGKTFERFYSFVVRFLPASIRGTPDSDLFRDLLQTVYYSHRSAFVHGGKEVTRATIMADQAGSIYFKHATEGREVRTPGLAWFARIVRDTLLGYLGSLPLEAERDERLFARLANEKAVLKLKVRRATERGEVVSLDDIEYQ
jgi:hypothetical protein